MVLVYLLCTCAMAVPLCTVHTPDYACMVPVHTPDYACMVPLCTVHTPDYVLCLFYAEYQEHPSLPTGEWVLTDTAEGSQLGTEKRLAEKEEIIGNVKCVV